jgi:CheY-like chemotaxis protein
MASPNISSEGHIAMPGLPPWQPQGLEQPRTKAVAARMSGNGATMVGAQQSVLLVDDDDLVRPVIADSLREAGYDVLEAADAAEAVTLMRSRPELALLISDVVMPGVDGPTMVAQLRIEQPALRVLFITGHAGDHSLAGERVLRKPFTNGELVRAVVWSISRPDRQP